MDYLDAAVGSDNLLTNLARHTPERPEQLRSTAEQLTKYAAMLATQPGYGEKVANLTALAQTYLALAGSTTSSPQHTP
jgi:hypothetical protein